MFGDLLREHFLCEKILELALNDRASQGWCEHSRKDFEVRQILLAKCANRATLDGDHTQHYVGATEWRKHS